MSERAVIQNPHMGVEADPELQRRMEVSALAWRLQTGAFDQGRTVAELLADAEETIQRLREAKPEPKAA